MGLEPTTAWTTTKAGRVIRRQADAQKRLVALHRRALAPEALEVREQPLPRLGHRHAIRNARRRQLGLDAPAHFALGLRAREARACPAGAPPPAIAIPARVPVARPRADKASRCRSHVEHSSRPPPHTRSNPPPLPPGPPSVANSPVNRLWWSSPASARSTPIVDAMDACGIGIPQRVRRSTRGNGALLGGRAAKRLSAVRNRGGLVRRRRGA
jgi:hypothetical protein